MTYSPGGRDTDKEALKTGIDAQHSFVLNHTKTATSISLYMRTSTHALWPLMQAGGSGKVLNSRVAVHKTLCWSNWVNCSSAMPESHNYEDYNITEISIRSGEWIDYISVTYTHRSDPSKQLVQQFGKSNGGSEQTISNIRADPIVKLASNSAKAKSSPFSIHFLELLEFTRASGSTISPGQNRGGAQYTDDYSAWSGSVWLCGLTMHGVEGQRVHGIGAHWCHNELFTSDTP